MIDHAKEALVPLCKAAKLLPSSRTPDGQHVATLHRWARKGVRGARLEVIRLGGTTCTSHEALARFFAAQSSEDGGYPASAPQNRSARTQEILREGGLTEPPRDPRKRDPRKDPPKNGNAKRPKRDSRDDDDSAPSVNKRA